MTFYVQGLHGQELISIVKVFKEPVVEKTKAIIPSHAINKNEHHEDSNQHDAAQAYQAARQLRQAQKVVLAEQIMRSPVVTLTSHSTVDEAIELFRARQVRHLPIISPAGALVGIVSERDILRHLGGITESYKQQAKQNKGEQIIRLMKSPVLTASPDTDIRYIARLFVEQRIGALPIVSYGELKGIIARSDVLSAVMRNFVLELWA